MNGLRITLTKQSLCVFKRVPGMVPEEISGQGCRSPDVKQTGTRPNPWGTDVGGAVAVQGEPGRHHDSSDGGSADPVRRAAGRHRAHRNGNGNQRVLGQPQVLKAVLGWARKLYRNHDLAYAGIAACLALGAIFNVFGLVAWFFHMDPLTAWGCWAIGVGTWMFSLAIFFFYMCDPQPKHSRRS